IDVGLSCVQHTVVAARRAAERPVAVPADAIGRHRAEATRCTRAARAAAVLVGLEAVLHHVRARRCLANAAGADTVLAIARVGTGAQWRASLAGPVFPPSATVDVGLPLVLHAVRTRCEGADASGAHAAVAIRSDQAGAAVLARGTRTTAIDVR